jgi:hypothetical protein
MGDRAFRIAQVIEDTDDCDGFGWHRPSWLTDLLARSYAEGGLRNEQEALRAISRSLPEEHERCQSCPRMMKGLRIDAAGKFYHSE